MGSDSAVIGGHDILALERFMDDTRHMIIFDVLTWKSPVGDKGERLRLFLSDKGYAKAQEAENQQLARQCSNNKPKTKKRMKLTSLINKVIEGRAFTEDEAKYIQEARAEMGKSGINHRLKKLQEMAIGMGLKLEQDE